MIEKLSDIFEIIVFCMISLTLFLIGVMMWCVSYIRKDPESRLSKFIKKHILTDQDLEL